MEKARRREREKVLDQKIETQVPVLTEASGFRIQDRAGLDYFESGPLMA